VRVDASGPPLAGDYVPQHELLDRHVLGAGLTTAVDALTRYFSEDTAQPRYTGRCFDRSPALATSQASPTQSPKPTTWA
jgi:hypothetical protein